MEKITINEPNRIETGPIQFNDDWPGYFTRGDTACWLAFQAKMFEEMFDKNEPLPALDFSIFLKQIQDMGSCRI